MTSDELLIYKGTKENNYSCWPKLFLWIAVLTVMFIHRPHSHIHPAAACEWGLEQQQHVSSHYIGCSTSEPPRSWTPASSYDECCNYYKQHCSPHTV